MKYQIPLDLIDLIQINLKNEANLHSFTQLSSSIPPLPSIEQAISSIELSSDNIRCNNCNGSFLRGFESVICIYCGQNNHQKSIPQSIPFKSTIGFRLLFDSLGLDLSESVGAPSDNVQSSKGQSCLKDKTSLADLLDLDLKLSDEFNRHDVKKDEIYPNKGFSNLLGEDFDRSFAEEIRDNSSRISIEQQLTREKFGNKESAQFEGQNSESYEAFVSSADGESSAWEAEFQSPNQDTHYDNLQSSNVCILPWGEGGIHSDSVSLSPSKSNLTDADHSSNSGPVNCSSKFDWCAEDLQKKGITHAPDDDKRVDDESDEWGEFRAIVGPENNHPKPSTADVSDGLDFSDAWNDFSGSVLERIQHSTCSQTDEIELQSPQISFDSQNVLLDDKISKSSTHMVAEAGDSFDFWDDFKSSTVERQETSNTGVDDEIHTGIGDSTIDSWNDIASSSASKQVHEIISAEVVVAAEINGTHDDSFFSTSDNSGAWNNFTGSTVTDDKPFGGTHGGTGHTIIENDGLLDSWTNFTSSNTQVGNSIPIPNATDSTPCQITPENQRVTADNGTFDLWGDFGSSILVSKTQSQGASAEFSENDSTGIDKDFFDGWNYNGNSNGITVDKVTSSSANDEAFDSWSEFASPVNVGSDSSVNNPANEGALNLNDPLDTWNTFASSSVVETSGDTKVVNESASERDLFAQADQLFATIDDEKCSSQVDASLAPEVPDLFRMENGDVKAEVMNQSEITTKPLHPSSHDVETLISEMHDLSFMLETTLSVPSTKS